MAPTLLFQKNRLPTPTPPTVMGPSKEIFGNLLKSDTRQIGRACGAFIYQIQLGIRKTRMGIGCVFIHFAYSICDRNKGSVSKFHLILIEYKYDDTLYPPEKRPTVAHPDSFIIVTSGLYPSKDHRIFTISFLLRFSHDACVRRKCWILCILSLSRLLC